MRTSTIAKISIAFTVAACLSASVQTTAQVTGANIIKFNLTSFATNHYMFQYEHVLSPKHSIAIGIGFSSGAELPFKNALLKQVGDNEDARNAIESTKFDKITITPEYRFYTTPKGAPLGFYVAPFMRYMHMEMSEIYPFTPSDGILHHAPVEGTFDCFGAGAMIGIQWALSKSVTLDWWIAGPFYGIQDGKFHGTDNMSTMTAQDAIDLEEDIEDVDLPFWTIDATISGVGTSEGTIDATVDGPYFGMRAFGFALGFRF